MGRFWARYQEKVSCWTGGGPQGLLHGGLIGAVGQLGQHHDVRVVFMEVKQMACSKVSSGSWKKVATSALSLHAEGHAALLADLIGGLQCRQGLLLGDVDAVDIQFGVPVYRSLQHGPERPPLQGDAVRHLLGGGFHLLVVQPTLLSANGGDAVIPKVNQLSLFSLIPVGGSVSGLGQ